MQEALWAAAWEHPDFVLLRQKERYAICCLVLEGVSRAQLDALDLDGAFHVYVQGDAMAVLLSLPEEEDFLGRLEEQLAALSLCAGLSGPFALTASARGCMRKAQIALHTGRKIAPGRALYPMDEFGEAALLLAAEATLARTGFAACDFADSAIAQMSRVDAQTGTQYARSLQAYLSHGLDLRRAAEALGVHRNTLAYRMKRVQELFEIDLSDVNTCFELLFSFWLTDHLPSASQANAQDAPFDAQAAEAALLAHVQRRAEATSPVPGGFGCRMLCVGSAQLADEERDKLLLVLRGAIPAAHACAYDDDVLLFACAPEDFEAMERVCRAHSRQKGCRMAMTQAFDASRLAQRAQLCRMALRADGAPVVRTQEMVSLLFFMTLERSFSLSPYLCEDVIRVMDDDAMRSGALSRSLYAYLLHFRDMKRAAQQLDMHRNTMEYHMRKIDALIGKPAGEKQRFLMMCTYKMLALPDM